MEVVEHFLKTSDGSGYGSGSGDDLSIIHIFSLWQLFAVFGRF